MEILQALRLDPHIGPVIQELDPYIPAVQRAQLHVHGSLAGTGRKFMAAEQLGNFRVRLVNIPGGSRRPPTQDVAGKDPHHMAPT
ncbi:hypothetical protein Pure05_22090 [Paenarthrobacter ureafaciens]|nr:hypothetical protein Pure01_22110 [Paenarthrobacter ureafaciens]GLU64047.1 hypothetical protein Pure02_22970 [Paenarthrobacter ureafaciens]GLU68323.1 hypothetical protein Pure03_22990 [Paenarthrobacter ureafaciens]GLU72583.1 hypothetical protein Pure04_22980 [Paenarthrobacter ureafaciens]GLU76769.1 hypothetical protein Pure05_22090 [Paenarthrobacter ureafaciens]